VIELEERPGLAGAALAAALAADLAKGSGSATGHSERSDSL
jgi:hypothetical protein